MLSRLSGPRRTLLVTQIQCTQCCISAETQGYRQLLQLCVGTFNHCILDVKSYKQWEVVQCRGQVVTVEGGVRQV